MAITEKIDVLRFEKEQRDRIVEACGILQKAKASIIETNLKLQLMADSGAFDIVDSEIKTALLQAWNVVKDAATAFEGAVPTDLLEGHVSTICPYCGVSKMVEPGISDGAGPV